MSEQLDIGLTDYDLPQYCSGCEEEFTPDGTMYVLDLGSAFPTFCSEECAPADAEKYRVEHLTDDLNGGEFARLTEVIEKSELAEVAEQPEVMEGLFKKFRLLGYGHVVDSLEDVWRHPDVFAEGEIEEVLSDRLSDEEEVLVRLLISFGVEYERAYPSGRREEWPIPLDERGGDEDDV